MPVGVLTDRQTDRQLDRQLDRQKGRQTGRQTDRQASRQTDGQRGMHTERIAFIVNPLTTNDAIV